VNNSKDMGFMGRFIRVENVGHLLAGQELLAHGEDPGGTVRNHHQLLGLAQSGPFGFSLQPRGEVRVAAYAAYGGGAVDAAAPGLAAGVLFRLAGLRGLLSAEWTTNTYASRVLASPSSPLPRTPVPSVDR